MTNNDMQLFGGGWTEQKLDMLNSYLIAWALVMKNQPFERFYIDAFAGTGYREVARVVPDGGFFAAELAEDEPQEFFDGSARMALQIRPAFDRYVFIEQSRKRFAELLKLQEKSPDLGERMAFFKGDSNRVLQDLCADWNSGNMRGVLFLDPFGMQVDWTTLEAVAGTQSIDVWILFPMGIGVNRMLPRDGKISDEWRAKLDRFFGATDWYEAFYRPAQIQGLFEIESQMVKTGSFNAIAEYYLDRLRTIFPAVAENPQVLRNSRNMPLFLLCFAAGNPSPRAKAAALRIAGHILNKS